MKSEFQLISFEAGSRTAELLGEIEYRIVTLRQTFYENTDLKPNEAYYAVSACRAVLHQLGYHLQLGAISYHKADNLVFLILYLKPVVDASTLDTLSLLAEELAGLQLPLLLPESKERVWEVLA